MEINRKKAVEYVKAKRQKFTTQLAGITY